MISVAQINIAHSKTRAYLASPYSHKDPKVMQFRFERAGLACAYAMAEYGFVVFSPIVHSHVVAKYLGNALDHEFWLTQDRSHIASSDIMLVLTLPGWKESYGVTWEIGLCNGLGKTIQYLDYAIVVEWAEERGIQL